MVRCKWPKYIFEYRTTIPAKPVTMIWYKYGRSRHTEPFMKYTGEASQPKVPKEEPIVVQPALVVFLRTYSSTTRFIYYKSFYVQYCYL